MKNPRPTDPDDIFTDPDDLPGFDCTDSPSLSDFGPPKQSQKPPTQTDDDLDPGARLSPLRGSRLERESGSGKFASPRASQTRVRVDRDPDDGRFVSPDRTPAFEKEESRARSILDRLRQR